MRWEQIDFKAGSIHVNRLKNGLASTHLIRGIEQRALRLQYVPNVAQTIPARHRSQREPGRHYVRRVQLPRSPDREKLRLTTRLE
jgi:hypothetical protein